MKDNEVLQAYIDLVPFLSKVLGDGTEVVVHDVTHPKRSLVAIANPLSGRALGGPMTDLAKEIVERGLHTKENFIANYDGSAKNINFLSSTYFIKNEGRLIGMLCFNRNVSASREMIGGLISFLEHHNLAVPDRTAYHENLDSKVEDYVETRIAQIIGLSGVDPERLNAKEKALIVKKLNENGVLKIKGAVEEASKQLFVSIPTIYRYLKK